MFCSKSHSNHVIFQKFGLTANTASLGGGGLFIGHFDNSSRNRVTVPENVNKSFIAKNSVSGSEDYLMSSHRFGLCGGGLLVFYSNHSQSSRMDFTLLYISDNDAVAGGGICILFKDSSKSHDMTLSAVGSNANILHKSNKPDKGNVKFKGHGGGILVLFESAAAMNTIIADILVLDSNTAFISGGGLFAGFYANASNNRFLLERVLCQNNTVKHALNVTPGIVDGQGGGISIVFSGEVGQNRLLALAASFITTRQLMEVEYI